MATFEAALLGYLDSNVSTTFYPGHLPENTALPAGVLFHVSSGYEFSLSIQTVETARYQFSFFSTNYLDVCERSQNLHDNLKGFIGSMSTFQVRSCLPTNQIDMYEQPANDSDLGTYHRVCEYDIKVIV